MRRDLIRALVSILLISSCSPMGSGDDLSLSSENASQSTLRSTAPPLDETIISRQSSETHLRPTSIATEDALVELSQEGPWLVYTIEGEDTYIVNEDGSGLRSLSNEIGSPVASSYDASTEYPLLAIFSGGPQFVDPPELLIVSFPDMDIVQEVALLACDNAVPGCTPDDQAYVFFQPKWSPNGRYLAFVGAIDGPSSDLYLYDAINNSIRRLTTGENQVGNFFWSPDSQWIIHEEVKDFHGYIVEAMWAASSINDEVRWLYSPPTMNGQMFLGWIDTDRFITYDHGMDGLSNLLLVSIQNGIGPSIFPGYFLDVPAFDPTSGTIAFVPMLGAPQTDLDESGIYLVSMYRTTPLRVAIDDINILGWSDQAEYFFTSTRCTDVENGYLGFTANGSVDCISYPNSISSPDGNWVVTFENGLQLLNSDEESLNSIQSLDDGEVIWRLDSNGFFLVASGTLYYVEVPSLHVEQIDEGLGVPFNSGVDLSFANIMWIGH